MGKFAVPAFPELVLRWRAPNRAGTAVCPFDPNPEISRSLGEILCRSVQHEPMLRSVLVWLAKPRLEQSVHSESCGRWSHSQKSDFATTLSTSLICATSISLHFFVISKWSRCRAVPILWAVPRSVVLWIVVEFCFGRWPSSPSSYTCPNLWPTFDQHRSVTPIETWRLRFSIFFVQLLVHSGLNLDDDQKEAVTSDIEGWLLCILHAVGILWIW